MSRAGGILVMPPRSKRPRARPPQGPQAKDIGAIWFLELELATRDGDVDAARAALAELERLGWDVRRRPRLIGGARQ